MKLEHSIIIPVYNEEKNLPEIYRRLAIVLKSLPKTYEVIFIDDGSTDHTAKILNDFVKLDKKVKLISFSRNFGQQAAVTAGLENSVGEIVTTLDADLQDPPELLPQFLSTLEQGYDIVYGVSSSRKDPWQRKILFNFYYRIMAKLSSYPFPKNVGIFASMRRPVVTSLLLMNEYHRWLPALRSWVGYKQIGINYDKPPRFAGAPPQTFAKLLNMGFDALFSFSYLPLRLATFLGLVVTVVAFFIGVDVIYQKYIIHTAIIGWSGPMLTIVIIGGAQLIILGIVGEYLGRIYDEVKHRPHFIISHKTGF